MTARLERDVERRAARSASPPARSACRLGMRVAGTVMIAFADDHARRARPPRRPADSARCRRCRARRVRTRAASTARRAGSVDGWAALHGSPLFVTATTTASSTHPSGSRTAAAQSRRVEPVVQTSSNKRHAAASQRSGAHANRPCAARRSARDRPRCASPARCSKAASTTRPAIAAA